MQPDALRSKFWLRTPPWLIVGILGVLIPTFAVMTATNIRRQKAHGQRLLVEKGAALIRSFEAGTRSGMMGPLGGNFKLQRLLIETARQPDIAFLMVVDENGRIQAHSDPRQVGRDLQLDLDLKRIARSDQLQWRMVKAKGPQRLFVVFKKFNPMPRRPAGMRNRRGRPHRSLPQPETPPLDQLIFVALDMRSVEAARLSDTRQTLVMGGGLLMVGLAGVLLLFYIQGYRTTRRSLSQIKAFSDTLVANLPLGLMVIDSDHRVAACNPSAAAILKSKAQDMIGQPLQKALPEVVANILPSQNQPVAPLAERDIQCRLGGKNAVLEITISPLRNQAGDGLQWILLIKEITEILGLRKAVSRHQRLVTVGRLAAGVAHEIRNPLSSIKGFATYFKQRYADHPKDQQTATMMIQEIDRLNRVVGQLLEFAKPVTMVKQRFDLAPLIQETLSLLKPKFDKTGIRPEIHLDSQTPKIEADPDQIKQVLINLLFNALEAMPQGGRISIEMAPAQQLTGCHLKIQDSGSGIGQDQLAHIFDPYFTTKPAGTGLGLAICHKIIEAHEGRIRISSKTGQGTTVHVHLPASASSLSDPPSEVTHATP